MIQETAATAAVGCGRSGSSVNQCEHLEQWRSPGPDRHLRERVLCRHRNYTFQFDATTWGWIHLLVGLLVAFAGWGLLSGRTWARIVAITLAVLSAIANFLWLPHFPFWALLLITLDIFVIWAIAAHGREVKA